MRRTVTASVPAEELVGVLAPRDEVILEAPGEEGPDGAFSFGLADGPVAAYQRVVRVGRPGAGGLVEVHQEVRFRVGVPFFAWLFAVPLRANLGSLRPGRRSPWWAPPARLGHRGAVTLATLCALSVLAGYLDGLLPATMTYAGREFGVGDAGQGVALGLAQVSSVLALVLLARADRKGRRRLILAGTGLGAAVSALGAVAPSLTVLTATQVAAGALLGAQYVLLGVMVIEEMPAGDRAWGIAVVTMSFGLGGGVTLLALPLADGGAGGWRWAYVLSLLAVPAVATCARHLPESGRWSRAEEVGMTAAAAGVAGAGVAGASGAAVAGASGAAAGGDRGRLRPAPAWRRFWGRWTPEQRRRLLIIGAGTLLFALFDSPAGQFQNQYLRTQRHWSALHISVAEQVAGTIGGIGTLAGGRLADTRGRRPVAVVAVAAGTVVTLVQYLTGGTLLYATMTLGSVLGYAVVPALAVYGGELFPTSLRGKAGGALTVLAAAGGLVGLGATGLLADAIGTLGPALAVMAVGPLLLVGLIARRYPETARRRLEDLNPSDSALPDPDPA